MRCLFLVKFKPFSLQLYYDPNSFTSTVRFHFMLVVKNVNSRGNL